MRMVSPPASSLTAPSCASFGSPIARGPASVVLGAETLADYLSGFPAAGAVIGRVANRIANARFELAGHAYFNLSDSPAILDHILWLDADRYTPIDSSLIPTGAIESVIGTPLDFTTPRRIGERIHELDPDPGGYDHNLIFREGRDADAPA